MNLEKKKVITIITNIIILLLLFGCLIGLFYLIIQIKQEGGKCLKSPLAYYNSLGKDKCIVTCLGKIILNENKILNKPVALQFNISDSELDKLFRE